MKIINESLIVLVHAAVTFASCSKLHRIHWLLMLFVTYFFMRWNVVDIGEYCVLFCTNRRQLWKGHFFSFLVLGFFPLELTCNTHRNDSLHPQLMFIHTYECLLWEALFPFLQKVNKKTTFLQRHASSPSIMRTTPEWSPPYRTSALPHILATSSLETNLNLFIRTDIKKNV